MPKHELEFLLALDNSRFNKALNASRKKVSAASKSMAASVKPAIASFGKLATSITKVGAAATAAAAVGGLYALNRVLQESVELANEQEQAESKLDAVIRATGQTAGLTSAQMKQYASDLQAVTTYGDEVTISAMAVMATFKQIKGDQFKRAISSAQDLATVLGTDLNSAVLQIGKALNDPVRGIGALSRAGIQFTNSQKEMIKSLVESGNILGAQKIILAELEGQFGGVARAARGTFGGSVIAAKNALGDLKEEIGFVITKNDFFVKGVQLLEQRFVAWTKYLHDNQGAMRQYAKDGGMAILAMAQASLTGLDLLYRGLNLLVGSFKGTAAAALALSGGIFKVVEAAAALVGQGDAAKEWGMNAEAAFAASAQLADEANQSFKGFADGSDKIAKAKEELAKFTAEVEKVPADNTIAAGAKKAAESMRDSTKEAGKMEQKVVKVGKTWVNVWQGAEKKSSAYFDKAMADLKRLQEQAARGVDIPVRTRQHRAAGGLALARGGRLPGYGGGDRIQALLEAGEFVVRKEAVARFGAGFFAALNSLKLPPMPRFAAGGPVGATPTGAVNINLTMPTGNTYQVQSDPMTADKMLRDIARMRRLRSGA